MTATPEVLFICRHNSGRFQIAAGPMRAKHGDTVTMRSGGIEPAAQVNAVAALALAERGIGITDQPPRHVTDLDLRSATIVDTLVDGVERPEYDGVRHERWILGDPASWDLDFKSRSAIYPESCRDPEGAPSDCARGGVSIPRHCLHGEDDPGEDRMTSKADASESFLTTDGGEEWPACCDGKISRGAS